nr:hypothetical protein [Microbacterium aquimaris]
MTDVADKSTVPIGTAATVPERVTTGIRVRLPVQDDQPPLRDARCGLAARGR